MRVSRKSAALAVALVIALTAGNGVRAGIPDNGIPDNGIPDNGIPDNGNSPDALINSPLFFNASTHSYWVKHPFTAATINDPQFPNNPLAIALGDPFSALVMAYQWQLCHPQGDDATVVDRFGRPHTFHGLLGLCVLADGHGWHLDQPLDYETARYLSSSTITQVNRLHVHNRYSLRGLTSDLKVPGARGDQLTSMSASITSYVYKFGTDQPVAALLACPAGGGPFTGLADCGWKAHFVGVERPGSRVRISADSHGVPMLLQVNLGIHAADPGDVAALAISGSEGARAVLRVRERRDQHAAGQRIEGVQADEAGDLGQEGRLARLVGAGGRGGERGEGDEGERDQPETSSVLPASTGFAAVTRRAGAKRRSPASPGRCRASGGLGGPSRPPIFYSKIPCVRTGAEYREALRDGRRVWVMGEGQIDDVTVHPATRAMVDEYAAWHDRHFDPEWQDVVLAPPDGQGRRVPWAFVVPRSADHLRGMGRCYSATTFLSAGNITHTPAYGHLIALGVLDTVQQRNVSLEQIAHAEAYRAMIARTGRFLTFAAGAATIGSRLRADPRERTALRIVRETDGGVIVTGKVGMHTSPAYAEDVYVGSHSGVDLGPHRATFIVPVSAPGVTVLCRKVSAHHTNSFIAPLSSRYDELDGQIWLSDVFIPWERVFLTEVSPDPVASWLFWHQLYCWLAKAEFTLGLALACTDAMGLTTNEPTLEYLIDLVVDVQTVRSCQTAAELDPEFTGEGYCVPGRAHVAVGSIAMQKARQRMAEILRIVPGSSLVVAPSDKDLTAPEVAAGLEESFGGGGYTALQRAALLQLASDHVASALDGRESAFELHANGGVPAWRARLRRHFSRYNELANGVLRALNLDMPRIDLESLRAIPLPQRRQVAPPTSTPPPAT